MTEHPTTYKPDAIEPVRRECERSVHKFAGFAAGSCAMFVIFSCVDLVASMQAGPPTLPSDVSGVSKAFLVVSLVLTAPIYIYVPRVAQAMIRYQTSRLPDSPEAIAHRLRRANKDNYFRFIVAAPFITLFPLAGTVVGVLTRGISLPPTLLISLFAVPLCIDGLIRLAIAPRWRFGRDPVCLACGYAQPDEPPPANCPECGAYLHGPLRIVLGHTRMHWGIFAYGLALLIPGIVIAATLL
jgi:hypothetical protein